MNKLELWLRAALVVAGGACSSSSHLGPKPGQDAGDESDAGSDAASGPSHAIHIRVVNALGEPGDNTFVAVQDGDGAWTAVTGAAGVYTAHVHDERFGVATGCMVSPKFPTVDLRLQTITDGDAVVLSTCGFDVPTVTVSGSLVGVTGDAYTMVDLGERGFTYGFDDGYYIDVLPGTTDVIASFAADDNSVEPKVLRKHRLQLTTDQDLPLDFTTDGRSYATAPLTAREPVFSYTSILVDGSQYRIQENGSLSDTSYQTLPAALKQPGDIQVVEVHGQNGRSTTTVGVDGALAVELPTVLASRTPVLVDGGYLRPSVTFLTGGTTLPLVSYQLDYATESIDAPRYAQWTVTMSDAWTAGASTIDYTLPDLSAVSGFDAGFTFQRDQSITAVIAREEDTTREQVIGRKSMRAEARFTIDAPLLGDHVSRDTDRRDPRSIRPRLRDRARHPDRIARDRHVR